METRMTAREKIFAYAGNCARGVRVELEEGYRPYL